MRGTAVVGFVMVVGCSGDAGDNSAVVSASTSYNCVQASAGQGFVSIPVENGTVLETLDYTIQPTGTVDAVVGLSAGVPTGFTSLATIARLNSSGYIDARDGSTYRADASVPYYAPNQIPLRIVADLTRHRYDVETQGAEVARQFQFRTEQANVTHLDHLGVKVDSPTGSVTVCPNVAASHGVRYSRRFLEFMSAMPNGAALLEDLSTITKVDASGHPLASIPSNSMYSFTDALGNVFLTQATDTTLTLQKLDSNLVSQWTRTRSIPTGNAILTYAGDGAGGAVVATTNPSADKVTVFRFQSSGVYSGSHSTIGNNVAVDGNGAVVLNATSTTVKFTKFSAAWTQLWSKTFNTYAAIQGMALAPDGSFVFGGEMSGQPVDFGGGPLFFSSPGEDKGQNGFVVRFDANGNHLFSERTEGGPIRGVVTNGHWIVVSATRDPQMQYPQLLVLTMQGAAAPDAPVIDTSLGYFGEGLEVTLSGDGRIYWNMMTMWPTRDPYNYELAL